MSQLRCLECDRLWSDGAADPGSRCGIRINGAYWCDGKLVEHGCGGHREACGLRGCEECGSTKGAPAVGAAAVSAPSPIHVIVSDEGRLWGAHRELVPAERLAADYVSRGEPCRVVAYVTARSEVAEKADAYNNIATAMRVGTCRSNIQRVVYLAACAADVREAATRARDEAVSARLAAEAERDALRAEAALYAPNVAELNRALDENRSELHGCIQERDALLGLLLRAIKYAREDGMVTPGSTRLARALAEAERLLAEEPSDG